MQYELQILKNLMSSNILHKSGLALGGLVSNLEPVHTAFREVDGRTAEGKNPFLVALGKRVGSLRARRGLTRKAVAISADVSERHLANLEYGLGDRKSTRLNSSHQ